jgi:hypothetical protein
LIEIADKKKEWEEIRSELTEVLREIASAEEEFEKPRVSQVQDSTNIPRSSATGHLLGIIFCESLWGF